MTECKDKPKANNRQGLRNIAVGAAFLWIGLHPGHAHTRNETGIHTHTGTVYVCAPGTGHPYTSAAGLHLCGNG